MNAITAYTAARYPEAPTLNVDILTLGAKTSRVSCLRHSHRSGGCSPAVNVEGAKKLGIEGNPHGIASGWFNWPYNFDPTWLDNCDGHEATAGTGPKIE